MSGTKLHVWLTSGLNPVGVILTISGFGALLGYATTGFDGLNGLWFGAFTGFLLGLVFVTTTLMMLQPRFYAYSVSSIRMAIERGDYPATCVNYDKIMAQRRFDERRRDELSDYVKSCPSRTDADFVGYLQSLRDAEELMKEYDKLFALKPK